MRLALNDGADGGVHDCWKYIAPSGSVPCEYPEGTVIPEGITNPP